MLDAELSIQSGMPAPFHAYQLDDAYDEMFTAAGRPRDHYKRLFHRLMELTPVELDERQQAADLSFPLAARDEVVILQALSGG